MIRFISGLAAVCAGFLVGFAGPGMAQESTPIVVLAEDCPMQEADLERVAAFADTPAAAQADDAATPEVSMPSGSTPDDATVQAVTDLIHLWIGCRNTNDTLYQFAVYTDAFLSDMAARYGPLPPELAVIEGRVLNPLPEEMQRTLGEIARMVALDDGRVAVELVAIDPPDGGVDVLLVAKLVDGRWLVDGLQFGEQPYVGEPLPAE